jgi:hypothetical protein
MERALMAVLAEFCMGVGSLRRLVLSAANRRVGASVAVNHEILYLRT